MRYTSTAFNTPGWASLGRILNMVPSSVRVWIAVISLLVIATNIAAIVVLITFESESAEYTSGGDTIQFYRQLDGELLEDYREVFGIAHNSGNTIDTTVEALAYNADIIEIDVVLVNGQLHAAHWSPFRVFGDRVFRGATLAEVWGAAAQADLIKLDLKRSSPEMVEQLLAFLADKRRARSNVLVVSEDIEPLTAFAEKQPKVMRMLSVGDIAKLEVMYDDAELLSVIDGVSVRHDLLDFNSIQRLKEKSLSVFAWTVNDPLRMNQLIEYGVDGITTDNLAIMQILGNQDRSGVPLRSLLTKR